MIFILTLILVSSSFGHSLDDPCEKDCLLSDAKIDCLPDGGGHSKCRDRKCVWRNETEDPRCIFDVHVGKFAGYKLSKVLQNSTNFFEAELTRLHTPSLFDADDSDIIFRLSSMNGKELEITFKPLSRRKRRNSKPDEQLHQHSKSDSSKSEEKTSDEDQLYEMFVQEDPFGFRLMRKATGTAVFDTVNIPGFVHAEQFLSLSTRLATTNIFGLGGEFRATLKHQFAKRKKLIMFARGENDATANSFGVHPFHICMENGGITHGIYFMNANAHTIELSPEGIVTYRTTGGSLRFTVLMGPSPDDVVRQYNNVVGYPALPPYWSMGVHIGRSGIKNLTQAENLLKRNVDNGVPVDSFWFDDDYYAEEKKCFNYDTMNFWDLPAFSKKLNESHINLILNLNPAIRADLPGKYAALDDGLESRIFVQDYSGDKPFEGQTKFQHRGWESPVYYPDFSNPNTTLWWQRHAEILHNSIQFQGVWSMLNEPFSFRSSKNVTCSNNKWNHPPFNPFIDRKIYKETLCMDARQQGGLHYDLHNLYAYQQSVITNSALKSIVPSRRPVLFSESTYAGSGTYAYHWISGTESTWENMKASLVAAMEYNFFGLPFTGSDVCGYKGDADDELCVRWWQMGAFLPLCRSGNAINAKDQDPASLSKEALNATRLILHIRYKFLPYLYTILWFASTNGTSVVRPLFFEFPHDNHTYNIDDQFLLGTAIMITPIVENHARQRSVYFPAGRWFQLLHGSEVENATENRLFNVSMDLHEIGLYVKGGNVVPWQYAANNTVSSRRNALGLTVALDTNELSHGYFFWDDGITPPSDSNYHYSLFLINVTKSSVAGGHMKIKRMIQRYNTNLKLDTIQLFGLKKSPARVNVNSVQISSAQIKYDPVQNAVTLERLGIDIFTTMLNENIVQWIYEINRSVL